jgi:V8-like Glu-specific endopeptidase
MPIQVSSESGRASRRPRFAAARVTAAAAVAVAAAAMVAGAAGPALAAPAGTAPSVVTGHSAAQPSIKGGVSAAAKFWTRSRMLSARSAQAIVAKRGASVPNVSRPTGKAGKVAAAVPSQAGRSSKSAIRPDTGPIGGPWPGNPNLPPATTTGRVFFTTNGGRESWSCSGSLVNSAGKNEVFTAGHCVFGNLGGEAPGEGWHSNWVFVPGYNNGSAPHGVWTARQLWTLTAYYQTQSESYDMGAVVLNANAYGQQAVNLLGGQGLAWNWPADLYVYDFGYPAAPPFNGSVLDYCSGYEFNWPYYASTMGLNCNFTPGSSGGPWLAFFNGELGYVNGVNAFGYTSLPGYIFSPYFGTDAYDLYLAA